VTQVAPPAGYPAIVSRALPIVLCLLGLAGPARADVDPPATRWLCAPPRSGPFNECHKGNSLSEDEVRDCLARQRRRRPRPPRLRISQGGQHGPWVEIATRRWRCVAVPVGRSRIDVENHGRIYASFRLDWPAGCRSDVLDLVGPSFYGAMYPRCSRRDHRRDDRSEPPSP